MLRGWWCSDKAMMKQRTTCGEATIRLLGKYGVSMVFGIPGVHTLDFCRGLGGSVRHIQARNEQGAGFMAEGWTRATGEPGVALAAIAPDDLIWSGDACQLVYTGAFTMPMRGPRRWFYPAGYCALGNALPNAIGAKLARPDTPVAVLAGDGGFMFTMPELVTAAELGLPLPIVIWENGGLKQIQDDMDGRQIPRVGVEGVNPDFVMLAQACHCHGVEARNLNELQEAFRVALDCDRPTVILFHEQRL